MATRPLAIVDLDGVVADVRHRLHHLSGRAKDWDNFFAAIPNDPPLAEGLAAVTTLAVDHDIVYLTGRPERTREATETWLARHRLPRGHLVMRRNGDRRPARQLKRGLVRNLARGRELAVVIDDDPDVCAALTADGWPVLVADWMTESGVERAAALRHAQEALGET